jgi:hypothetical protein
MAAAMNKGETLREYFQRARHDPAVRTHLLENARYSRSCFGWMTLVFGVLALGMTGYQVLHDGVWMTRTSVACAFSFTVFWLIYDKFGDRVATYASMDEVPSRSPMPATRPTPREPSQH